MSGGRALGERELADIERRADPTIIPTLVSEIRRLQHDVDNLELSLDVARRDREELRAALIAARERTELRG